MIELLQNYWSLLFSVIIFVALGFVFLMKIKYKLDGDFKNASWYEVPFIAIAAIIFYPSDWLLNVLLTVAFLDLPGKVFELTTHRMHRYKQMCLIYNRESGIPYLGMTYLNQYRFRVAVTVCGFLNLEDKEHC